MSQRRMPNSVRAALALLVATAWFAPGTAQAANVQCGEPVMADAVLKRDLVCAGDGPVMTTGDVTLDLRGHTIRGSGEGTGIRVQPCGQSGTLRVRNGTITNFGTGVSGAADVGCEHTVASTIERLVITGNGTGVFGGIDGASAGSTLVRLNVIRANTGGGVVTAFIRPFHVINNVIARNGGDGVSAFEDSIDRFEGNVVSRNGGHGAAFDASVSTFRSNAFLRNAGIGLTVDERVCEFKPLYEFSGNIALRNGGGGLRAAFEFCEDPTVPPPGSGNFARHNANFQCILIRCGATQLLRPAAAPKATPEALHVSGS